MLKKNKEIKIKKTKQGKKAIICNLEKMNLQIYNQWGEKIYDSAGLTIGGIALLHIRS
jgi:hypothetical protein